MKNLEDFLSHLHHAIEVASNCAGPDGAKDAVKRAVAGVVEKAKGLGLELLPVAEKVVETVSDTGLKTADSVIEEKLGGPAATLVEAGLDAVVHEGLQVAEQSVGQALDVSEPAVTENK